MSPNLTERVRSPETAVEQEFLVAAVSNPGAAADIVGSLGEDHFADPVHQRAFLLLKDALAAGQGPGVQALLGDHQGVADDPDLSRLMVRVLMEADPDRFSAALLRERALRLREQYLVRAIGALRRRLEEGGEDADTELSLVRLEHLLHEVRAALAGLEEE